MRTIARGICGALVLSAVLVTPASATDRDITDTCGDAPPAGFDDVDAGNVHGRQIDCIKAEGITAGTTATTYTPASSLRRDQLASFLARTLDAAGQPLPAASADFFTDDDGNVHEDAINRLAAAGIVSTSSPTFGPAVTPDRGEMARLTVALLEWADALDPATDTDFFTDDEGHPDEGLINRLADAGVITGKGDGTFAPSEPLRRDQMATFLARTIDALRNGPGSHDHCRIQGPDARFDASWYTQQCEAVGIPVLGSDQVDPAALSEAAEVITGMIGHRSELHATMSNSGFYYILLGEEDGQTDPPEYRHLKDDPDVDWDERARGVAGADFASAGEENVLCWPSDEYRGESILVHEFSHSILDAGLAPLMPDIVTRVQSAYDDAMAEGRWENTYAAENYHEYWAEGVQSYFDANLSASPPDGIHNHVDTREELAQYDPALHDLVDETLGGGSWRYACP